METKDNTHLDMGGNERLRRQLDDFYVCADVALSRLGTHDGFVGMCDVLSCEIDNITNSLKELYDKFREDLPLSSAEPTGIVWYNEKERMSTLADRFVSRGKDAMEKTNAVPALYNRMTKCCELLENIDNELFPLSSPKKYISYGKREKERYYMTRWNKDYRENRIITPTSAHENKSMQQELEKYRDKLHSISEYILSQDNTTVYYEGLGRHLWQVRHSDKQNPDVDRILFWVRSVENYSQKLNCPFMYLDSEPVNEKGKKPEPNIGNVKMFFGHCKECFVEGFDADFVENMLSKLLKDNGTGDLLYDKLSDRKRPKFVYQLAGVFLKAGLFNEQCDARKLAVLIKHNETEMKMLRNNMFHNKYTGSNEKPTLKSRIDYVRHGVDDVAALQDAIEMYIKNHKNDKRLFSF